MIDWPLFISIIEAINHWTNRYRNWLFHIYMESGGGDGNAECIPPGKNKIR